MSLSDRIAETAATVNPKLIQLYCIKEIEIENQMNKNFKIQVANHRPRETWIQVPENDHDQSI